MAQPGEASGGPCVGGWKTENPKTQATNLTIRPTGSDSSQQASSKTGVIQFSSRVKDASGEHEFDLLCESLDIEHRLTKPRTPRTNGMVERFNGRLEQVLQTHRFNSAEDLSKTLHRYVWLYNQHLPQKALNYETPLMALKRWQESHSHLFKKKVINHPGPEIYPQASAAQDPSSPCLNRPLKYPPSHPPTQAPHTDC
jgi:hypothetical protein